MLLINVCVTPGCVWLGSLATTCVTDVGPASVMVGNIVQGNRLASAQGRDMGVTDEESDSARKVSHELSTCNNEYYF